MQFEGLKQFMEHEVNKDSGITAFGTGIDRLIIPLLVIMHHGFNRQVLEYWIQPGKDQRLPEPPHASIAVCEGVNEFKFVVKNTAADQQMILSMFQPVEEVGDQGWHTFCGRSDMDSLLSGKYTDSAMTEFSCLIDQMPSS